MRISWTLAAACTLGAGLLLAACGGSGGDAGEDGGCTGSCASPEAFLSEADVGRVIAQAVAEAGARGVGATIAVVDRVGNVLAVFRMHGALDRVTVDGERGVTGGLEGVSIVPAPLAAIAKAITGAYLSSEGNAFSTRTASQIVQEHFNPGELNAPGGPLFGVQFSQLPCSDLMARGGVPAVAGNIAPRRSPLGLAADPGGFPLYKGGTPVGGVGVVADGTYGLDLDVTDFDLALDELIALAATAGFEAPAGRRADVITVEGKTLRYSDAGPDDLLVSPDAAAPFAVVSGGVLGDLVAVATYTPGTIAVGTVFGEAASGIEADDVGAMPSFSGLDAFVLTDGAGNNRFPPSAGTDGRLGALEVRQILTSAFQVAAVARAQIRRPLGSSARVSIAVVDTNGAVLGIVRSRDAPVFGIDVAVQKARTAAFFSGAGAAADIEDAPDTVVRDGTGADTGARIDLFATYVGGIGAGGARDFLGSATALADGAVAFSDRAGGNLSRPYFPDGVVGSGPGPFSRPFPSWSPFAVGLQLDLVVDQIVEHVAFILGLTGDAATNCTAPGTLPPVAGLAIARLANGIQIFPGSVPIYDAGGTLLGGIGVSGDGVDQDDMIAFLGLHNAGAILAATGTGDVGNAPPAMRADQVVLAPPNAGVRLRYVQCPPAPFLDSDEQQPCDGL